MADDQERTRDELEAEQRDELEDLDVTEQQAEDVRGGKRARQKRGLE